MEFEVTPERAQLRATVRRIVSDHTDLSQLLAAMADPDADTGELWQALVRIGVIGLRVPSRSREPASSFADVGAVLQELGRGPACVPYLGTAVLAPQVLADCGTELAHELAAPLSTGDTLATVSLEHDLDHLESIPLQASNDAEDRWRLTGTDRFVLEAAAADLLLLPALIGDELGLFAVDGDAAGLRRDALTLMDQTRRVATITLDQTPARLLARGELAGSVLRRARAVAHVALACEQVGGAERCLERSVEYAKQRRQFGVPIGSFQAIKHRCADMLASVELARSVAEYACWCVDERPEDLQIAALVAGSMCSQTYLDVAAGTIQIHGGIGFTWENPAHLYFKRAKTSALMYGQPVAQRYELGTLIGL